MKDSRALHDSYGAEMSLPAGTVSRIDPMSGIRDDAAFFGSDQVRMLGLMHVPRTSPTVGLVICSPLQAEFVANYRREVLLGRQLAERGVAAVRFHYRGTGNSHGEASDSTFESMVEDAIAAAEWLKAAEGIETLLFLGTRWGALIAEAASTHFGGVPLILWEPVVEANGYFRLVFRAKRMHELKEGIESPNASESPLEELARSKSVDVLGYSIDQSLYESATGRTLLGEHAGPDRRVLLVQIGQQAQLRGEYRSLVERLTAAGSQADTRSVEWAEEAWWFPGGRSYEEERALTASLVETTSDWILHVLEGAHSS